MIWQDPIPAVTHKLISKGDIKKLKKKIMDSGLSVSELVKTAWGSAASFRASDMRGGANGARIALLPQKDWMVNEPETVTKVVSALQTIQKDFNDSLFGNTKVSLADLIVLGGAAAIEKAADDAGMSIEVPFTPCRGDATQEYTDVDSFALLEPTADAFRNYFNKETSYRSPTQMLVDKADQLNLTAPEMTVLIGGMRVLDTNSGGTTHGVLTKSPGELTNEFFVHLLDMSNAWRKSSTEGVYEGFDRRTGKVKFTATKVDLIFGSHPELRALAEAYALDDAKDMFVDHFVKAWVKVMRLDRFDL